MKTREEVLDAIRAGRESGCGSIDRRDYARLCDFMPVEDYETLGFSLKEGIKSEDCAPKEWTRENILDALKGDLEFGFEKALNGRGISAGLMFKVIRMWLWVLNDELQDFTEYAQYGLPLFKAVAVKYGFDNPIGEDAGNEYKYSSKGIYS